MSEEQKIEVEIGSGLDIWIAWIDSSVPSPCGDWVPPKSVTLRNNLKMSLPKCPFQKDASKKTSYWKVSKQIGILRFSQPEINGV